MARPRKAEISLSYISLALTVDSYFFSLVIIFIYYTVFPNGLFSGPTPLRFNTFHQMLFQRNYMSLAVFAVTFLAFSYVLLPMFMLSSTIVNLRTHRSPATRMTALCSSFHLFSLTLPGSIRICPTFTNC